MSDPIRKLAEEIASAICYARSPASEKIGLGTPATIREHWEARLRSALPELSQVLGELAVAREALEKLLPIADRARIRACGWGEEYAEDECDAARSALASDAGRLAGEVIQAAGWLVEHEPENGFFYGPREQREHTRGEERLVASWKAILSAFPAIREEVKRG